MRRVGYLGVTSIATGGQLVEAFKQGMRDLGWVEGTNIEYRMVYAEGEVMRLDGLARALLSQQVEVIAVGSAQAALAAQKATKTVPIVMTGVGNAVDSGFVTSLASPGGNVTGVSAQSEEVLGKLIEILHGVVPAARRISFLLNEGNPTSPVLWASAQAACAKLKLVALPVAANSAAEFRLTAGNGGHFTTARRFDCVRDGHAVRVLAEATACSIACRRPSCRWPTCGASWWLRAAC